MAKGLNRVGENNWRFQTINLNLLHRICGWKVALQVIWCSSTFSPSCSPDEWGKDIICNLYRDLRGKYIKWQGMKQVVNWKPLLLKLSFTVFCAFHVGRLGWLVFVPTPVNTVAKLSRLTILYIDHLYCLYEHLTLAPAYIWNSLCVDHPSALITLPNHIGVQCGKGFNGCFI